MTARALQLRGRAGIAGREKCLIGITVFVIVLVALAVLTPRSPA
jgi:hypothetical protein